MSAKSLGRWRCGKVGMRECGRGRVGDAANSKLIQCRQPVHQLAERIRTGPGGGQSQSSPRRPPIPRSRCPSPAGCCCAALQWAQIQPQPDSYRPEGPLGRTHASEDSRAPPASALAHTHPVALGHGSGSQPCSPTVHQSGGGPAALGSTLLLSLPVVRGRLTHLPPYSRQLPAEFHARGGGVLLDRRWTHMATWQAAALSHTHGAGLQLTHDHRT